MSNDLSLLSFKPLECILIFCRQNTFGPQAVAQRLIRRPLFVKKKGDF